MQNQKIKNNPIFLTSKQLQVKQATEQLRGASGVQNERQ